MDNNKIKNTAIVAIEFASLLAIKGHVLKQATKAFQRNFIHSDEEGLKQEFKSFSKEIIHDIKDDLAFMDKVVCFHPQHSALLKKTFKEAIMKTGIKSAVSTAIIDVAALEGLPAFAVGILAKEGVGYLMKQHHKQASINNALNLREKFTASEENNNFKLNIK